MAESILYSIGQGIALGTNTAFINRNEASVRAGRAPFAIGAFQSAQIGLATSHVIHALEAARVTEIPTDFVTVALRVAIAVIPFFLGFALHNVIHNDTVRCIAIFIQNHIGNLCQIVSIVSAVALMAFGNIALGASSLTFMALGILDRYLFPESVSYLFRKVTMPLCVMTSILTGGLLEKVFATLFLAATGYEEYYKYQNQDKIRAFENREALLKQEQEAFALAHPELLPQEDQTSATVSHSGLLTPRVLEKILDKTFPLKVNPLHLKAPITIQAKKTTQLETLLTVFDEVEWDDTNMRDLTAKLLQDDRFRQFKGVQTAADLQRKGISNRDLCTHSRQQLEQFIKQIKARHVEAGAIHEYERLENYLKIIIEQLPNLDPNDRASYIARLAVEGGQYCGPGRFHAVEEIWAKLVWKTKDMPLGTKVLFHLQDARTDKLRDFYAEFFAGPMLANRCTRFFNHLVNATDLHTYNQMVNLYAEDFGIRKGAADNDEFAVIDSLTRIIVQRFIDSFRGLFFTRFYTLDFVTRQICDKSGTPVLPKDQLTSWWQYWMLKQDEQHNTHFMDTFLAVVPEGATEEEAAQIKKNEGTLYGKKFMQASSEIDPMGLYSKIDPLFIKAMLFDMGILEHNSSPEEAIVEPDSIFA